MQWVAGGGRWTGCASWQQVWNFVTVNMEQARPTTTIGAVDEQVARGGAYGRRARLRRKARILELQQDELLRHPHVVHRRLWKATVAAPESYVRCALEDAEEAGYMAAGVLPFCTELLAGGRLCVLLGAEVRGAAHNSPELNLLGGKREIVDTSAAATAWREFDEETGELMRAAGGAAERRAFMAETVASRANASGSSALPASALGALWYPRARYALFTHRFRFGVDAASDAALLTIDERYAAMPEASRPPHAEMTSLHWVALDTLLAAIASPVEVAASGPLTDVRGAPLPPPATILRTILRNGAMRAMFDALLDLDG